MPLNLTASETTTKEIIGYAVASFENSVIHEKITIRYKTIFADGSTGRGELISIKGKEAIQALYAEMDSAIASGKSFENASKEILYSKLQKEGNVV